MADLTIVHTAATSPGIYVMLRWPTELHGLHINAIKEGSSVDCPPDAEDSPLSEGDGRMCFPLYQHQQQRHCYLIHTTLEPVKTTLRSFRLTPPTRLPTNCASGNAWQNFVSMKHLAVELSWLLNFAKELVDDAAASMPTERRAMLIGRRLSANLKVLKRCMRAKCFCELKAGDDGKEAAEAVLEEERRELFDWLSGLLDSTEFPRLKVVSPHCYRDWRT